MICPGCKRDNDPRRRYCGTCGVNFEPVCRRCSFANESGDRFCGGCGALLVASEGCHPRPAPVVHRPAPVAHRPAPIAAEGSAPVRAPTASPVPSVIDELAGLFAPTAHARISAPLPKIGIEQGDLDKLFGGNQ